MTEDSTLAESEVLILLATLNGAEYVNEQLNSIVRQSHTHWRVIAADDGSTDGTVEILKDFSIRNPGKLEFLGGAPVRCAKDNFFRLLREAKPASYYAFCDQDDVWLENKLQVLVAECKRLEAVSARLPCIV